MPREPISEAGSATDSDEARVAADPERAAVESARRARRELRRWCIANGVDRLGTLTFRCRRCDRPEGCVCAEGPDRPRVEDLDWVLDQVAKFRRRMRDAAGGRDVALVVVVEEHEDGHLHVHFGFNRKLDRHLVRRCWGLGFVDLRRLKSKHGERLGRREQGRRVAMYLAKYVTKQGGQGAGRKRYSTTRGMTVRVTRSRFMSRQEALVWLELQMGGDLPDHIWESSMVEGWDGPPVMLLFYGDGGGGGG